MSENWYRNTEWTPEIAAAFDAKLARSRTQKAQYLRIQGSILAEHHPRAARELFERCIALGDAWTLAAAQQDSAFASCRLGEFDVALETYEAAIEQQRSHPLAHTEAPYDYCLLVATQGRTERYERALALLGELRAGPFALTEWKKQAARAMILASLGRAEEAQSAAELALGAEAVDVGWIPGFPDVGVVPGDNPLSERLRAIAAG